MQHRPKLHPSSCFPPHPSAPTIRNRLFIRIAPTEIRHHCPCLTFIGINTTTYSTIAALLACEYQSTTIEYIKLFDLCETKEVRMILNDLQLIALFNKSNIRLEKVQSYWETKDSNIIIINVQHNQLDSESISTWIQMNASIVENIVSQICIYSPNATLIICTQPNELMTYVAFRASKFPIERIIGLGASIDTAYAHRNILDQNKKIHGRVNGFFVLGNGLLGSSCTKILTNNLTIDGIHCSDLYSNRTKTSMIENQFIPRKQYVQIENIRNILRHNSIYSNVRRRLPIVTELLLRQKTATEYLISNSTISHSKVERQESIYIPFSTKLHSNWTEALLLVQIIRALINGSEFQSNFAVNIAPIHSSINVFINYPTIIGSSSRGIEYMLPFYHAQEILKQIVFLVPHEKLQTKIDFTKSKDKHNSCFY